MPEFWVLLENEFDHESIVVSVTAESVEAAQAWGQDCDRGDWDYLAVLRQEPKVMDIGSYERLALKQDGTWYRPYRPTGGQGES